MKELNRDIPRKTLHNLIVDNAFEHPYSCTCQICQMCWALLGPDGGERDNFGPFTTAQIREAADYLDIAFNNGEVFK